MSGLDKQEGCSKFSDVPWGLMSGDGSSRTATEWAEKGISLVATARVILQDKWDSQPLKSWGFAHLLGHKTLLPELPHTFSFSFILSHETWEWITSLSSSFEQGSVYAPSCWKAALPARPAMGEGTWRSYPAFSTCPHFGEVFVYFFLSSPSGNPLTPSTSAKKQPSQMKYSVLVNKPVLHRVCMLPKSSYPSSICQRWKC